MRKKLIFLCDNCKREFEVMGTGESESDTMLLKVNDIGSDQHNYRIFDICMECRRMFLSIFEKDSPRISSVIDV